PRSADDTGIKPGKVGSRHSINTPRAAPQRRLLCFLPSNLQTRSAKNLQKINMTQKRQPPQEQRGNDTVLCKKKSNRIAF
ncbi:MAG: hypothetical protein ACK4GN_03265, partial [Runella sp.]